MTNLESLAATISSRAADITRMLKKESKPVPSFAESSYNDYASGDEELRIARNQLIDAAKDAIRLAQGPEDHILDLGWSTADASNLATVASFDIAGKIAFNSRIAAKDLAAATGLPEGILTRIVRYAIANGMFQEDDAGYFSHTAASAALARNRHLRDIVMLLTHELSYLLVRLSDTLKQQQEQGENGPQSAFNLAFPDYVNIFQYFSENTTGSLRYHNYLKARGNTSRWAVDHLLVAWDWSSVGKKTIVDVGGSSGHTCQVIATKCPSAQFVIQDIDPHALVQGRELIAANPDLQRRTTFVSHDFFTPQTTKADIYILRHILHDWADGDVVRILQNLLPALTDGARVLVSEGVVPEPPAKRMNTLDEKQIRFEDMLMHVAHGASERTTTEYVKLFQQSSEKFQFVGVSGGHNGAFESMIEFVYKC